MPFPRRPVSSGICDAIRQNLRSTTPKTLPDRTVSFVDRASGRDGEFFCATPIAPSLVEVKPLTPAMCDAATKKTREIDRKRWLKLHAYIANRVDRRSLSFNDLKDADEFFECLAGGDDTVDADELESALRFCGMNPSRKDIDRVMLEIDQDGSGELDRDEFITLLFDAEMSQRFFDAARSGDKRSTMLTVPLWSLTYQRKKKLQGCYEDYGAPGDQAAASPKRETVEGVVAIESPGGRRTSRPSRASPRGPGSPGRPGGGRSSAEVADALEHHQRIRGTNTLKEGPKAGGDDDDDDSARSAGRRPDSRRPSAARGSAVGFRVRKNTAALNAAAVVTAAVHEEEKVEVVDEAKMRQRQITRYAPQYAQSKTSRFRRQGDAYRDDNDVFVDTYSTARVRKGHRARGVVDLGTQKEGPMRGPKKAAKTREQIAGRRGGGLFAGKAVGVVVGSAGGGKLAGTGQMVGPGAFRRAGGVRGGLS
ncbi:hypothetical protein JL722_8700 [Aureococcus anophagefferens]|nr:hypothetical protein JL722_8700 [Aureococcus anophagefferens]